MNKFVRRCLPGLSLAVLLALNAGAAHSIVPAKPAIPFKQDGDSGGSLAARAAGVLALAALAAFGAAVAIKRFGLVPGARPGKVRQVRLTESVRLSRRSVLHVVDYGGEQLLLAESEHGISLVSSRPQGGVDA
ncbi:flagellar biosynthetic protein FliO [Massilia sp. S19_KUP03_FR1]|uniref:flagellar biosynthetic protein FliO n=1 Tax=Massilia sp. S19_KUP03_FR1 TaxID=3025503 RepID=UPI002FCDCF45